MNLRKVVRLLKETFQEWQKDKASRIAAALAYYTVFSISPLLVIAIAIAGAFFGQDTAQEEITSRLTELVGEDGVKPILMALNNISQPKIRGLASLISIGVLVLGASGIFAQLQDALNTVWKVKPQPGQGMLLFIRKRLSSFLMVLAIGFLLMLSLILSAVVATLSQYRTDFLPGSQILWENLDFIVSLGLMTFLFGLMFKYVPDVTIAWKDVFVGSLITALLFIFGKFLLGVYISRGSLGSAYGAAGSLIVFLAWVYYSAQIILFGAEFTQVYSRMYGSKIKPNKHSQID
ncbi:YihY/virulence factor BrkB family protein [Waterburya agarophytonicola K14]|uniref:YihY/virulence factor BrkB family protein n=1 Tax=Waterburya agarophytonicola KI4 TaxID=2874699 RepID=A0A964BMQ3_9CYAN|nr:YihY/virulence factor BrkB family protein [Waterburya agarophytonicola]MCC0176160.1 YihY/virulence factor BrkB family protein [Waterburya agarophytonicola KI4]